MKKFFSLILLIAVFSLYSGVYAADSIVVKLPDNSYYDASQYIEFDENTTVYPTSAANISNPAGSEQKQDNILKGSVVKISKGTSFDVYLQDAIDTAYAEVGEDIAAMIKEDYVVNGSIIIPQGSFIKGSVVSARHAGKAGRNGKVSIVFDKLELPGGEVYNITAEKVDFEVSDSGSVSSTALTAAGAMVIGAALGSVFTGSSGGQYTSKSGKDYAQGAATGAIVTGALVVGYLLLREGKNAVIPQYTEIAVVLEDSLDITTTNNY